MLTLYNTLDRIRTGEIFQRRKNRVIPSPELVSDASHIGRLARQGSSMKIPIGLAAATETGGDQSRPDTPASGMSGASGVAVVESSLKKAKKPRRPGSGKSRADDSRATTPISKERPRAMSVVATAAESDEKKEQDLIEVLRDFISRAFMQEVAFFPERIQDFVEANQRRIQQSVGDTSWS